MTEAEECCEKLNDEIDTPTFLGLEHYLTETTHKEIKYPRVATPDGAASPGWDLRHSIAQIGLNGVRDTLTYFTLLMRLDEDLQENG